MDIYGKYGIPSCLSELSCGNEILSQRGKGDFDWTLRTPSESAPDNVVIDMTH